MFERSLAPARRSAYGTRALPGAVAFHLLLAGWAIGASLIGVGELPPPPEPIVFTSFLPNLPEPEPEVRAQPTRPPAPQPAEAVRPEVVSPQAAAESEIPQAPPMPAVETGSLEPVDGALAEGDGGSGTTGSGTSQTTISQEPEFIRLAIGARPPQVLYRAEPRYLEPARRARVQGVVELDLAVDARGRVVRVDVLRALPLGLTEEAERAVRQWRFRPAERNGQPVPVRFSVIVNFTLR
jgi:protein TonB